MKITAVALMSSLALTGVTALFVAGPARAFPESRPADACAPLASDLTVPGLWLGHFTGGRLIRGPDDAGRTLAWRDDYSCFTSARACALWQRDLRRKYSAQEGYRTCLPLRGGGTPIVEENVIRAKY
jgi:hypothetical protein